MSRPPLTSSRHVALRTSFCCLFFTSLALLCVFVTNAEDPYKFLTWRITSGMISPLGVRQQAILINGMFPGPDIVCDTNDNLMINVINNLPEPFLISWNGIQQRGNSWQDGVYGTNCPILPGTNFTYHLHVKDQIGSFFYFPSLGFHKAAGGFGGFRILRRPNIPLPFLDTTAGDITVLIGDWYNYNHAHLKDMLDHGRRLPPPDGILINGRGSRGTTFTVSQGQTYRFRISNVGLQSSLNFMIQGHTMKLVEVEGTHTQQTIYTSLDIHVGQSYSVLVNTDQPLKDYYIAVSTRFTKQILTSSAILHYFCSNRPASGPVPHGPRGQFDWSLNQALSIRTNLTANGPRPNPQGSYHYGQISVTRTIRLANSAGLINGMQRYAVNSISFVPSDTPLKLADYLNISGVFHVGSIPDQPTGSSAMQLQTSVMGAEHKSFVEILFENSENYIQSWHLDGHSFFLVGMDKGGWTVASRKQYNLKDAVSRCTTQVYPKSWTAVYVGLDNRGMWNLRSQNWPRQYLGQQFYLQVYAPGSSPRDENPMPPNAIRCGKASLTRCKSTIEDPHRR